MFIIKATMKNLNPSFKSELVAKNPCPKLQISAVKIEQKDKFGGVQY